MSSEPGGDLSKDAQDLHLSLITPLLGIRDFTLEIMILYISQQLHTAVNRQKTDSAQIMNLLFVFL